MNIQQFCDADTMATWIFNWVFGCLILAILTQLFFSSRALKKAALKKAANEERKAKLAISALEEIELMQLRARIDYENATNEHDKAKALYAYEQISDCLSRFTVIRVNPDKHRPQQEKGEGYCESKEH